MDSKLPEECLDAPDHKSVGVEQQQIRQLAGGIRSNVSQAATAFSLKLAGADTAASRDWERERERERERESYARRGVRCPPA